ncbi:Protein preY, mitochondrial [Quillaja saponaria]|uniref:Protein preY, mitochondrial n=1 Tax=Quillaja saponaria TaxID=32244 RepID=A0AAD7P708_QUISA|nr:Protein preY, mitochondrial [Quillaja saponaria]
MVRLSAALLKNAGTELGSLGKTLSEFLVCPLSKQPLRYCEETNSLISDTIGVSFPIKDGIPCLVPKDGKILDTEDTSKSEDTASSSAKNEDNQG